MKKYPAHERWVAVPNDMLGDDYNREELRELAKRGNIGVLVFSRKAGTEPGELIPPVEQQPDVDFLAQYSSSKKVLKALPPR